MVESDVDVIQNRFKMDFRSKLKGYIVICSSYTHNSHTLLMKSCPCGRYRQL